MTIPDYETWADSLGGQELQEAYMLGGSDDEVGLMRAYHIIMSEVAEEYRDEQRDMDAFERNK